ncbi:hypothetical protein ACWD25_17530 [Streptomyces sp. NPDC002920]
MADRFDSYFQHPSSVGEVRGNIREIKAKQAGLRRRGDHDTAGEWDAELRYQERLQAGFESATQQDIDRIWGQS